LRTRKRANRSGQ